MPSTNALTTIQKLYIAYYGRAADAGGQRYWAELMDNAGGSLNGIIDAFSTAPEAQALYGSGTTVNERITVLYQNILGRAPEANGLTYWAGEVAAGRLSLGNAALTILNGVPPGSTDAALVNNRLAVANTFTAQVNDQNYGGDAAAAIARTFLKQVTGDAATLSQANSQLPAYLNTMGVATRQPDKFAPLIYNGLLTDTAIVRADLTDANLDAILDANGPPKAPWTLLMTSGTYSSPKILISDGTAAGTDMKAISGTFAFGSTKWMVNSDKTGVYFFNNSSHIEMLGYSDGTLSGTNLIAANQNIYNNFSTLLNNKIIFAGSVPFAESAPESRLEKAYAIDGTEKTFISTYTEFQVPELESRRIHDPDHQAVWFANYDGELVLFDYSNPNQISSKLVEDFYPWITGGIQNGFIRNIYSAAVLPNGKLIFSATDDHGVKNPWVSDGTEEGTFMLKKYKTEWSMELYGFRPYGNKIAFITSSDEAGIELAFTDGTSAGTTLLDINPGNKHSSPVILGEGNGQLYFIANTKEQDIFYSKYSIHYTNGVNFNKIPGIIESTDYLNILGWGKNKAFFRNFDSEHGEGLWVLDFKEKTFSPVGANGLIYSFGTIIAGDRLIFNATLPPSRHGPSDGLFVSDGTPEGTVHVGARTSISSNDAKVAGDTLVFSNEEGIFAVDLREKIPVPVQLSTVGLTDAYIGSPDEFALQTDADQAFYVTSSRELFASKGTTVPTAPLVSQVTQFKVVAENALFIHTTNAATNTQSLWYSDGTTAGTRFIEDLPNNSEHGFSMSFDLLNAVAIKTVGVVA